MPPLPIRLSGALLISLLLMASPLSAADLDDERDLAEQIAVRVSPEEIVKLEISGIPFQGLYRDSPEKQRRGGVIILHGRKANQDAAELIHPLRTVLPTHGWATLSISLPLAETRAESENFSSLLPESVGRLRSAIDYLKPKELGDIALIGHDSGAWVVLNYLIQQPDDAVRAVVLIDPAPILGLSGFPVSLSKLSSLTLPLLELISRHEGQAPNEESRERRTAFKALPHYRQVFIETPDMRWKDTEEYLIQRIHGWLQRMEAIAPRDTQGTVGQQ